MKHSIITYALLLIIFLMACSSEEHQELLGVWETHMPARKGYQIELSLADTTGELTFTDFETQKFSFLLEVANKQLTFAIPEINAVFNGAYSSENQNITGIWEQTGQAQDLIFYAQDQSDTSNRTGKYKASLQHALAQDWHVLMELSTGNFGKLITHTYIVGQAALGDPSVAVHYANGALTVSESTGNYTLKFAENKRELIGFYTNNKKEQFEITFQKTAKPVTDYFQPSSNTNYQYSIPAESADFDVASLTDVGLHEEKIAKIVNNIYSKAYPGVHSMLIFKQQKLVLEEYFYDYDQHQLHDIRSVKKSLVALALGIAIDKGFIKSVDDQVIDYLPEYKAGASEAVQSVTFKDFITMSSGLACDDMDRKSAGNQYKMSNHFDWVKFIVDLPKQYNSDEESAYCSGGVGVVMAAIANASGLNEEAFFQQYLFEPLGIVEYDYTLTPKGQIAFMQLKPKDMLKIGVMMLNNGLWKEKEVVPTSWLMEARAAHATLKIGRLKTFDYGYLMWLDRFGFDGETRGFHAAGAGGQAIYVIPDQEMVVVFTAGNYNSGKLSNITYEIIRKNIIEAIK
ncbi:MAG: serine hydrolase domain-containing protein [Flammeovirgaceae bacterium]